MFAATCSKVRPGIYGYLGTAHLGKNQVGFACGSAFMIAPGVLATTAHSLRVDDLAKGKLVDKIEVICTLDIGKAMEVAEVIAVDDARDIALLRLPTPRSTAFLALAIDQIPSGTSCGSLGFPLGSVAMTQAGPRFNLIERFQGSHISATGISPLPDGTPFTYLETDSLMYGGSSGCPGFLLDGRVFGMQSRSIVEGGAQANAKRKGVHFRPAPSKPQATRIAISLWVASSEIVAMAGRHGIAL